MFTDPEGTTQWLERLIAGVITAVLVAGAIAATILTNGLAAAVLTGAAIGAAVSLGSQAIEGDLNWEKIFLETGVGAISGALGACGISRPIAGILGGVIGRGSNFASQLL